MKTVVIFSGGLVVPQVDRLARGDAPCDTWLFPCVARVFPRGLWLGNATNGLATEMRIRLQRLPSSSCPRRAPVLMAGYFFAVTYSTCTCSMVPLNLNGTLS